MIKKWKITYHKFMNTVWTKKENGMNWWFFNILPAIEIEYDDGNVNIEGYELIEITFEWLVWKYILTIQKC